MLCNAQVPFISRFLSHDFSGDPSMSGDISFIRMVSDVYCRTCTCYVGRANGQLICAVFPSSTSSVLTDETSDHMGLTSFHCARSVHTNIATTLQTVAIHEERSLAVSEV